MKLFKIKCLVVYLLITLIALATFFLFQSHISDHLQQAMATNYHRPRVESTVRKQIKPLENSLGALGFANFGHLDTRCGYVTYNNDPNEISLEMAGTFFECSSGIDRFVRIPTDEAGREQFIAHAKDFDRTLSTEGWKPGANLPWFKKVSQKGNFIANDQVSSKSFGRYKCMINFFTAYSDPDPPAISVRIYCGLGYKAN